MIHDHHVHRGLLRFQFQAQLFLQSLLQRWPGRIGLKIRRSRPVELWCELQPQIEFSVQSRAVNDRDGSKFFRSRSVVVAEKLQSDLSKPRKSHTAWYALAWEAR